MSRIRSTADWRGEAAKPRFEPRLDRNQWGEPDKAPRGLDLQVQVSDGMGTYVLPFPCRLSEAGWIGHKGQALQVTVVGWRYRSWARPSS